MRIPTVLLALSACASAIEPNQLTEQEKKDGFTLIFDGKTTTGWRNYKKQDAASQWSVKDGALALSGKGGGDLISAGQYANFEFRFQFQISADGNSGVMWRVAETKGAPYETGPEYQILDSHGKTGYPSEIKKGNVAGAFYDLVPAKPEWAKPAGEWNDASIKVDGAKITLTLNGQVTADVDTTSDEWKKLLAKSKFATWAAFGKEPKGHFCLQDHGNPVAFRTMRVKVLP